MDQNVSRELSGEGFRHDCLDMDVTTAASTYDHEGTCDVVKLNRDEDGCTMWERKLHTKDIVDSSSSPLMFSSRRDLQSFLDSHNIYTGNPFTGNSEAIMFYPQGDIEAENLPIYIDLAQQLVVKFGKYIKEVEMKFFWIGNIIQVQFFLIYILKKLPNLKSIHLDLALDNGRVDSAYIKQYTESLKTHLNPDYNLDYLNFRVYRNSDINILAPILDVYGPKLRKISVTPFTWDCITADQQKKFVNLEEFNLCWFSNQISSVGLSSMYAPFEEGFAPSLKILRLLFVEFAIPCERPVEWLFYILLKFPRLTLLNLTGFHLIPDKLVRVKDLPGNASTLKSLKFQDHTRMNYDFLIRLIGLENLFIEGSHFLYYETEEDTFKAEEGEIKLRRFLYRKQLLHSNVWHKLPNLKQIVFQRNAKSDEIPPEPEVYLKPI